MEKKSANKSNKKKNSIQANIEIGGNVDHGVIVVGEGNTINIISDQIRLRPLHQLPPAPADFTGREELIKLLVADFERGKGATITGQPIHGLTGMGGIGKTTLGLVVAHRVAKDYPDAQIFLDLKGATTPLSAMEVMRHVILSFEPKMDLRTLDEANMPAAYQSAFHGKKVLLFLDNARSAEQIASLRPPETCAMLVTSRWTFSVPGLRTRRVGVMLDFDAPAKSPFMDMMLVPVYAGAEGADMSQVTVSPRIQQNLGVRTAEVIEGTLSTQFSAVGSIAWNERDQAVVQARATGYVERLHARATLDRVAQGQPLAELYVPDWVAAQEEYLALKRMQGSDLAPLIDAARARMRQAGMTDSQIALVESSGHVQPRITIRAPISGVLTEVMAREGMAVAAGGTTLYRINGTSVVWAQADVPESQVALLRPGTRVQVRTPALPGETFEGRVQALLPEVNPTTRTLKARLEIANRSDRLAPGMFVQMHFMDLRPEKTLLVPTEAVIQTGQRAVVMLAEEGGKFRPVTVEVGIESGGQTEIKRGLKAGDRVVVSSQFLIDSEASLKGIEARLNAPERATPSTHRTEAVIEAIKGDAVTLSHPPIASLKWPEMTMDFMLPPASQRSRELAAGERVDVEFRMQEGAPPQITSIRRLAPDATKPRSKP